MLGGMGGVGEELIPADAVWITIEKDYTKDDDYRRITIRQEG